MNFSDIFKKSFLTKVGTSQTLDIIIALLVSIVIGAYIFYFYKKTYKGIVFSKMFAAALTGMTVITTFIILAVTSNVVLSLGMVGALSIVRFRSSIKEPVDIVYIFWAISEGIVIGSQQYALAIIGTICISIAIAIFSYHNEKMSRYMLVVRYNSNDQKILEEIKKNCKRYKIQSNTLYNDEQELIIELILEENETKIMQELKKYESINMLSIVKYNGEYVT